MQSGARSGRSVGRVRHPPVPRTHGKPDELIVIEVLGHFEYDDTWRERALRGETLVIIGNTPGDDDAGAAAGLPFIAVATGVFSVDDLRETGAVLVVANLADSLDAVLAAIEGL